MKQLKATRRVLIGAGAAVAVGAAAFGASAFFKDRKPSEFNARLIVGSDTDNSIAVQWEGNGSWYLELRKSGSRDAKRFTPQPDSYTVKGRTYHLQTVRIAGLHPSTTYEYQITGPNDERSGWTAFRTSDLENCRALIFPDSQSNDRYKTWEGVYNGALGRTPDIDFTCNMGDLVDCGAWLDHWDYWFSAVKGGISRIPVAVVMGNHDTYDMDSKTRVAEPVMFLHSFPVPDNGSENFRRWYYTFDSGPVHFIVLNTEWQEADLLRPGLLSEMKTWFRNVASKTDKPWSVVLMHRDVLYYKIKGRKRANETFDEVGKELMPLFDEAGVDLVLTVHLHTYRRRDHIKAFARSEDGPLYIVTGVAGNIRYPDFWIDHPLDVKIAPQPETDNYLLLDATGQSLSLKTLLPNGNEIDSVTLTKNT